MENDCRKRSEQTRRVTKLECSQNGITKGGGSGRQHDGLMCLLAQRELSKLSKFIEKKRSYFNWTVCIQSDLAVGILGENIY